MITKLALWERIGAAALFIFYLMFLWSYSGELLSQCIITIIFLAICCIYLYYRLRKEGIRADSEKLRADEFGEVLIDRFGYQTGKLEIEASITNYNGDCDTKWAWTEIKKIHPDYPVSCIPGRIYFSTQGASFSKFPELLPEYAGNYEIEFLSKDTSRCLFQVRVKDDTSEIAFGYTASANRAFCMNEEELAEESFKDEWFGFHAIGIIENLSVKVFFPRHYKPDGVQPDVCIGTVPTGISDNDEIKRILKDGGFRIEPGEISLTVKKPRLGYLYYLRWRPLPEIVVEGMRQRE